MLLLVTFVAGCASNDPEALPNPDTTRPQVSYTSPENGALAVPFNRMVLVAFSEKMDPLTLNNSTFTVSGPGAVAVPGLVTPTGSSATFTPINSFQANTTYTATITTGVKDLAGNTLANNYAFSFTTGVTTDSNAPTVSATSPANTAAAVPLNRKVTIDFSEVMNPSTINTVTFKVAGPGVTLVTGTVVSAGTSATFTPSNPLVANTLYTVTATTGAMDLAGNPMAADYVFTFTTGSTSDTTKPTVASTTNANGAVNVPVNTTVGATFSEAMDPLTISSATFTLKQGATVVPGTVAYSGLNAVFTPANNLGANTVYTATISTGAADKAGNGMAVNHVWSFTTSAIADNTAPTVLSTNPADLATNIALNSSVNATFSELIDPQTISTSSFLVGGVTGTVDYNSITRVATFRPLSNFAANTTYTATVTADVTDLAGNQLLINKIWSFTTGTIPAVVPVINLRTIEPFGSFGGTAGMTNTGTLTQINGDTGTIATGTASITGFHDTAGDIYTQTPSNIGSVNGKIYSCTNSTTGPTSAGPNAVACTVATQARLDAQTAYLALVAMPVGGASPAPGANLAGLTLAPGVYVAPGGSFLIEGGDLTLDAQGDANAVWVFQMAQTLTVGGPGAAAPQSIILAGGAQAKNIFWQVGSFATINAGGGGTMQGTIISQAGASFSTAGNVAIVTLNGRALSLGASVTLVNTVINVPAP